MKPHINRRHTYQLTEYEPFWVPNDALPFVLGQALWQRFDEQKRVLQVGFPSPKTAHHWSFTSLGWVGFIQVTPSLQLQLSPRFPIKNLFVLWAYAYGFEQNRLFQSLIELETVSGFQAFLANWLAKAVFRLAQSGFSKAYVKEEQKLAYVRGRFKSFLPAETAVLCQYDQLTTDIPDNQILAYTLQLLCHSPNFDQQTQRNVRQATHLIHQVATPYPLTAAGCYNRSYHRLNQNYRLLHQLCGFFIEHVTPHHQAGQQQFPAFLMHTPRLFERFVARWLSQNLPQQWRIETQERVVLDRKNKYVFQIDIVLYNKSDQKPLAVLDTKYKRGTKIAASDIHQLIAYAKVKSCQQAILIFPSAAEAALDLLVDDIQLQAISFDLNQPIEVAGKKLLKTLINSIIVK